MKRLHSLVLLFSFILFGAMLFCYCGPNRRESAAQIYDVAIDAFSHKDFRLACRMLDSLSCHYADVPNVLSEVSDLRHLIVRSERDRHIVCLDSQLLDCARRQRDLLKLLAIDDKNAALPIFVDKAQQTWRAYQRCYLRATTDINGLFELSSCFVGERPIHHDHVRVSLGDTYVVTPATLSASHSHSFSDGEYHYEVVRYSDPEASDIAALITEGQNRRIRVDYLNDISSYTIYLTETDKNAIVNVYRLASVLKESQRIKKEIRSLRRQQTMDR